MALDERRVVLGFATKIPWETYVGCVAAAGNATLAPGRARANASDLERCRWTLGRHHEKRQLLRRLALCVRVQHQARVWRVRVCGRR